MTLEEFFKENNEIALAFSGGVDSSYLLYAACKYAEKVKAYYVKSAFQPQFELDDAIRLANQLGADMEIVPVDVLADKAVADNPANRCYFCKKTIFGNILNKTVSDGFKVLIDGTNASDDYDDRPGMKALQELKVLSPLRLCGITKAEVRRLSKEASLFTWDKPAYACLATRIPSGTVITAEKLAITEKAEGELAEMGFTDFRVRMAGDFAKIQLKENQFEKLFSQKAEIIQKLKPYYKGILLDLEAR